MKLLVYAESYEIGYISVENNRPTFTPRHGSDAGKSYRDRIQQRLDDLGDRLFIYDGCNDEIPADAMKKIVPAIPDGKVLCAALHTRCVEPNDPKFLEAVGQTLQLEGMSIPGIDLYPIR